MKCLLKGGTKVLLNILLFLPFYCVVFIHVFVLKSNESSKSTYDLLVKVRTIFPLLQQRQNLVVILGHFIKCRILEYLCRVIR